MIRIQGALLLTVIVFGACSHQQKVATVVAPPPAVAMPAVKPSAPRPASPIAEIGKTKEDSAIYFDFDSSLLRNDARPVLQKVGSEAKTRAEVLRIEGNCDEDGTIEYNLALGEQRARAAKEYLVHLGVPADRIAIASFGSQRPKYGGHDSEAHAKNRRDDLMVR